MLLHTCSTGTRQTAGFDDEHLTDGYLPCAAAVLAIGRHQGAIDAPHLWHAAQEVQQRGPVAEREVSGIRPRCRRVLQLCAGCHYMAVGCCKHELQCSMCCQHAMYLAQPRACCSLLIAMSCHYV